MVLPNKTEHPILFKLSISVASKIIFFDEHFSGMFHISDKYPSRYTADELFSKKNLYPWIGEAAQFATTPLSPDQTPLFLPLFVLTP